MSRTKGILTAAMFTGLVLITVLALGFGSLEAQSIGDLTSVPTAETGLAQANGLTNEETLQAWQEYSAQLEQAVRTLQGREIAYRQQLDEANRTILQLQSQINRDMTSPYFERNEED